MNIRTFLAALVGASVATFAVAQPPLRVHFTDIKALTFRQGAYSTSRRLSPVPQLKCVGGPCSEFPVSTVQCRNVGHDGQLPQWECKAADLSNQVQLHTHDVVCEGYEQAGDPYVLYGSCGLEYSLKRVGGRYTNPRAHYKGAGDYPYTYSGSGGGWGDFVAIAGFFLVARFLLSLCRSRHYYSGSQGDSYCHDGRSAYGGYDRPAYYQRPSGFWTGAGLGSLAGYWAGRGSSQSYNHRSYSSGRRGGGSSTWGSSSSGGWGGSRTATSFAGSRSR